MRTQRHCHDWAGATLLIHVHVCFIIVIPDAIDFHAPVKLGHIIHLTGRVTFTSNKSMEIEVVVDAKDYLAGKEISRPLHVVTLNMVIMI